MNRASEVGRRRDACGAANDRGGRLIDLAWRLGRSTRMREVALVGAVLGPVLADPAMRRTFRQLNPSRQAAVVLMTGTTLAGHYVLGTRSFPFVNWDMYTSPVCGDPVIFEYHLCLDSGTIVPLALSHLLGTVSAARLMEALRRQVSELSELQAQPGGGDRRREHELTLRAIAAWHRRRHPDDPPVRVLVSERTISLATGSRSASRPLWAVELA